MVSEGKDTSYAVLEAMEGSPEVLSPTVCSNCWTLLLRAELGVYILLLLLVNLFNALAN